MKLFKLIEQLRDVYKKVFEKIKVENERYREAGEKHEKNKAVYSAKAIRDEYDNMREEHVNNMNAILKEVKEAVANVRAEYEKEAQAEYQPKGEALNADDVALLNSGIVLSSDEVERMAMKYADNITMLRVIENHVKKSDIQVGTETKCMFLRAGKMLDVSMQAFDAFVKKAKLVVDLMRYNNATNEIFVKCNAKIGQYVEEYKNNMKTGIMENEDRT